MTEFDLLEHALRARADEPPLPRLDAPAAAAGLLDVSYCTLDSPVGTLLAAGTERGLVRIAYMESGEAEAPILAQLAATISPRVLEAPGKLDEPRRELEEY